MITPADCIIRSGYVQYDARQDHHLPASRIVAGALVDRNLRRVGVGRARCTSPDPVRDLQAPRGDNRHAALAPREGASCDARPGRPSSRRRPAPEDAPIAATGNEACLGAWLHAALAVLYGRSRGKSHWVRPSVPADLGASPDAVTLPSSRENKPCDERPERRPRQAAVPHRPRPT